MRREVLEDELVKIVEIGKEFGVGKVFLFGSCLEDAETANDIDIAVEGVKPSDFFEYYGKVSLAVNDEVDIVDLEDLREHMRKRVLSKGRLLYEKGIQGT